MLDRLSSKVTVFATLLGAAGVAWGVFAAGTIAPAHILLLVEGRPSATVWAMPVAVALVLISIWLANWTVLGNPRRALSGLHASHFFTLPYLVTAAIAAIPLGSCSPILQCVTGSFTHLPG
jgi:hypothetical protein